MLHRIAVALAAFVLVSGNVCAAEITGKIKSVKDGSIVVTDKDGKDHTFKTNDKTALQGPAGKPIEMTMLKEGFEVTVKTAKDSEDTAETITLQKRARPDKIDRNVVPPIVDRVKPVEK